jgi:hypothetical protein
MFMGTRGGGVHGGVVELFSIIVKVQCRILTSLMTGRRKILLAFLSEVEAFCLRHSINAL